MTTRPTPERLAEIHRLVEARDNLGYDSTGTQEKRELLAEIDALQAALSAVRAHHVRLNTERGRAVERSHTIRLCDRGLRGAA